MWVCLKIVYPYTQWLMIIIPFLNGYNWRYTPFSDIPMCVHEICQFHELPFWRQTKPTMKDLNVWLIFARLTLEVFRDFPCLCRRSSWIVAHYPRNKQELALLASLMGIL